MFRCSDFGAERVAQVFIEVTIAVRCQDARFNFFVVPHEAKPCELIKVCCVAAPANTLSVQLLDLSELFGQNGMH